MELLTCNTVCSSHTVFDQVLFNVQRNENPGHWCQGNVLEWNLKDFCATFQTLSPSLCPLMKRNSAHFVFFFFAIYELFSWHCSLPAVCHKDFSVLCTCLTDYNIVIICFFAFRPFSGKEENTLRAKNQNLLSEVIFLQPAAASSTDGMGGSMSVASSSTGDNRY